MSAPEFESRRLSDDDVLDGFGCGVAELDTWLVEQAQRAQRAGTARTTVWRRTSDRELVGYFSICPTEVRRDTARLTRRWTGGASIVPGFMLARLAVAQSVQGQGLGEQLLLDALETIADASARVGGRVVVVDPVDEGAAAFYRRYGFVSIGASTRMYLLVQDVQDSLSRR